MYRRVSVFLFPDPIMWVSMVILGLIVAIWSNALGFGIEYGESWGLFYIAAIFACLGVLYRNRIPNLAVFSLSVGLLLSMTLFLRPLSYLAIAQQFPMVDHKLGEIDKFLGFDWLGHVKWVNDNPIVYEVLHGAYQSLSMQLGFVFVALLLTLNLERLREFLMLFFTMSFVTIFFETFFPAVGASYYYQPSADIINNMVDAPGRYSYEHFMAVHDGTKTSLLFEKGVGLITFPSFHTQVALLLIWAARRTILFWPSFILNSLMVISTVAVGGHYIIDIIAGGVIAVALAYAYGLWAGRYQFSLTSPRNTKVANSSVFMHQLPLLTIVKESKLWHWAHFQK